MRGGNMVLLEFKFQVFVILSLVSSSFSQLNARKESIADAKCGNRIVEDEEECDCGTLEECISGGHTCCSNCKFTSRGTVCRIAANSCDVPEYCNGTTEVCPIDLKTANGISCDKNKGYCHEGKCRTHTKQCNDLWNGGALKANDACYDVFNLRGDKLGYCKKHSDGRYMPCALKNAQCGTLWCIGNGTGITPKQSYINVTYGTLNSQRIFCHSVEKFQAPGSPAVDTTLDGIKCGNEMVCRNNECVSLSVAYGGQRTCANNCSGNGVCNENGNCHCNKGWKCPNCSTPYDGPGGSSDSGLDCLPVTKLPCQCTYGSCCKNCQIVNKGTVCREAVNSCDVPEYCDGESEVCPVDLKTVDGLSCNNQQGYCYRGECRTRDEQCNNMWFGGAHAANDVCYATYNKRGDRHGYCKIHSANSYLRCSSNNTLCGKLWCIGKSSEITAKDWGYGIYWSNGTIDNGHMYCRSVIVKQAAGKTPLGTVLDGTKCGNEMVCKDNACVSLSVAFAEQPRCANNCNGNGVCNENGNCHCNPGWRCPNCTEAYDGPGGSIDNGLSCQAPEIIPTKRKERTTANISVILSIVFLCVLILVCAGIYRYTRQRCIHPYNSEEAIYEEPVHPYNSEEAIYEENHVQAHENNVFDSSSGTDEDSCSWVDDSSLIYDSPQEMLLDYITVVDENGPECGPQISGEPPLSLAYMALKDVNIREPASPYQHLQFSGIRFSQLDMPGDGEWIRQSK